MSAGTPSSSSKVVIDCGVHFFEGLRDVSHRERVDDSWTVYGFEANPIVSKWWRAISCPLAQARLETAAVWIRNEKLIFRVQNELGDASTLMEEKHWSLLREYPSTFREIEVQAIDFSEFLRQLPERTGYIVVKMDIEGAEFPVLEHLVRESTHTIMDRLYVEFHDRYMGAEFSAMKQHLLTQLYTDGVDVIEWY